MSQKKFVAAINCMDGRTQLPVNSWLKKKYKVDYVDTITEPGPVKILANANSAAQIKSIKNRLEISVKKHGAKAIAIVAHDDCAGNPVDEAKQKAQLKKAINKIESWKFNIPVIALWVGDNWQVSLLQ